MSKNKFKCTHCERDKFSTIMSLRTHVSRNHPEIVAASKTFSQKGHYKCTTCPKTFTVKNRFNSHINKCPGNPLVPTDKKMSLPQQHNRCVPIRDWYWEWQWKCLQLHYCSWDCLIEHGLQVQIALVVRGKEKQDSLEVPPQARSSPQKRRQRRGKKEES
jgi:DNA-directed RNA polymerase subunit RPC12/RpoP